MMLTPEQQRLVNSQIPKLERIVSKFRCRLPNFEAVTHGDDFYQAGYIGIVDAAKRFEDGRGRSFESWAHLLAVREMIAHLRQHYDLRVADKKGKQRRYAMSLIRDDDENDRASEAKDQVRRLMRGLTGSERAALLLRYGHDMTNDEACGSIGVSPSQVSILVASGMAKIREKASCQSS